MRVGDRVIVTRACAEAIPYDIKTRIRWYMARQLEPVAASKLIFDLGLHSSYARALPAILRKMPELDRSAVIFKARETVKAPTSAQ
jgi:hypothetical protein